MSGFAFPSPAHAVAAMLTRLAPVGAERIPLHESSGRILAEPIAADRPSPAVDVSAMDGYALRLADLSRGRLPITADAAAGRPAPDLPPAAAVRIATGAPVPAAAEIILRCEDVREGDGWIEIPAERAAAARPGDNIRRRGENISQGAVAIEAGREITPPVAGALATFGCPHPLVHQRVRIAVVVTGDEVLAPDESPQPWQLRDANGPALMAMLAGRPWLQPRRAGHAADDPQALHRILESALDQADALVITGGVSMGQRDFVPRILRQLGAEVLFHKLPQRPGKPVLGAILPGPQGTRPVMALPGNPVSVMVTARRMLSPVLARLAGIKTAETPPLVQLISENHAAPHKAPPGFWWQRPVRVVEPGLAELIAGKGSGDVASAARSDGFIELPPDAAGTGPWPFYSWSF